MDNYNNNNFQAPQQPGRGQAIASMVLGIVSCVFMWFGYGSLIALACGIVGLFLWSSAKKQGYVGSMLTAGFVLSLIGTILSALIFVSCVACVGCAGCVGAFS